MFYAEELVEEVRSRNDVLEVVSAHVRLTKKGNTYLGLCPFHNEKTPSFTVTPSKQMYYCFGCGAGGNAITFLMEYENISFPEAIKQLAERVGISLPETEEGPEARRETSLKNTLLEMNREAGRYFYFQLKSERGRIGYEYLRGRGLTEETIRRFGLGYALPYTDALYRYLKEKGYSDELIRESGLVRIEERGVFDKFWNRVMFPIMDVNNRILGFGGRVMGDGEPKYLNSPETRLFDKSRNLYGLNYARAAKRPYILICEGYMDVISVQQAGFANAVASLGTALTEQQAAVLKRYTQQVVLAYDSDGAGVKAAIRAIPILRAAGLSVKVLKLQPYKDPDEFMKALGVEELEKRIEKAENFFLFETEVLSRDFDMTDPEQKTAFYRAVAKKLLVFSDELERGNYLDAVCSRFLIPKDSLKKMLSALGRQVGLIARKEEGVRQTPKKRRGSGKEDGIVQAQRMLLTWLTSERQAYERLKELITPEDFTDELMREVAQLVFAQLARGEIAPAAVLNHFIEEEEQYREVARMFNAPLPQEGKPEERDRAFEETVKRVKKHSLDLQGRSAQDLETLQRIIRQQSELEAMRLTLG